MPVSPPRPTMPHLNALRAFEAAARHNSISLAANELYVTPAAVAQQIKTLETWLGDELFKRHAKGVELTPLGASVLDDFSDAFDALVGAVQKLRVNANPKEVRIAALPSIAQLWVSPRLPAIRSAMPDVSISVTALEEPPNLKREPYDLAIFYGDQPDQKNEQIICQDVLIPVCTPLIAERIQKVSDLRDETFLHDSSWNDDWSKWLSVASPDRNLNKSGPTFSLYSLALEECKNGAGVLMGHEALVQPLIDKGELETPIAIRVELSCYMFFETRPENAEQFVFGKVIEMLKNRKMF
ncbi:MAG: LysR family transcriptional regulator [Rhizobiaceae bacterium]|nr:LysR family transcriptional regulator [Rhizobiaceae bacterium]